jgi:hypothetical protein
MGWLDKLLGRGESEAEQVAEDAERGVDSEADALEEGASGARDELTDISRDPRR